MDIEIELQIQPGSPEQLTYGFISNNNDKNLINTLCVEPLFLGDNIKLIPIWILHWSTI